MSYPRCGPERARCEPCPKQTLFTVGIGYQMDLHIGSVVSNPTGGPLGSSPLRPPRVHALREKSVAPTASTSIHTQKLELVEASRPVNATCKDCHVVTLGT